mmetsp:Transcript_13797/g.21029  ORF Transcript_13797/g.21029 Transcript_13797/m.21029 type:complete len:96 (+) Transcript_13797:74-361(+)|eukprot:CAMPEP_0178905790 /NCGR_PEP_ID=MMETSP0786-20121207/6471_1 /TAXON_ID=186022 /ORGANISM="Thalassionema frauenfeldii, Strain CCMP 1798" /LENGTH=95 /DNA_ID=CAMNT_0020577437 /DNA_START=45 /DNA_END=332 /DNA_ORIENTATION=-
MAPSITDPNIQTGNKQNNNTDRTRRLSRNLRRLKRRMFLQKVQGRDAPARDAPELVVDVPEPVERLRSVLLSIAFDGSSTHSLDVSSSSSLSPIN